MKLLVGGCSHSAGSEIIEPWHPRCPEQAWGQHLANHFNCTEYINIAGQGYSNQWICNKTIKFLAIYLLVTSIPLRSAVSSIILSENITFGSGSSFLKQDSNLSGYSM